MLRASPKLRRNPAGSPSHTVFSDRAAAEPGTASKQLHMKHQKGLRQERPRRRQRSMPARVLSGTAVLAAAWSVPQRCCHALRASVSSLAAVSGGAGYQYRSYVGIAAQRASRTTATLAGGFVPGGAGRRKVVAAVAGSTSGGGFGGRGQRARRGAASVGGGTATRMVSGGGSDESVFFTDPDAPAEVDGVGPPGPLVGDDQVRAGAAVALSLGSCEASRPVVLCLKQLRAQSRALVSASQEQRLLTGRFFSVPCSLL